MIAAGDSISKSQKAPTGEAAKDTGSEGAAAAKDAASKTASAAKGAAADGAKLASKAGKHLYNAVPSIQYFLVHLQSHCMNVCCIHVALMSSTLVACLQSCLVSPLLGCTYVCCR